jgi:hypothetical protein
MKKHKKLIYIGVVILCAISLFFFFPEKNVIDVPSVARIYEFPKDALTMLDVTEQEGGALKDEELNKGEDARIGITVIAAYEIVPKVPFTFYPVRVVITTLDKFPDRALRNFKQIEEKRVPKRRRRMEAKVLSKFGKLFGRHQEADGSESGFYISDNVVMSQMEDDGSFSSASRAGHDAFVFENHNEKKKYSFRIMQSLGMYRPSIALLGLKPMKNGERYYEKWYYLHNKVSDNVLGLYDRVDFNHIFFSLRDATINHIEETGVVEKFYAKRAAEKTQQPPAPKP